MPKEAVAIIRRHKNAESKDIPKLFTGSIVTYEETKPMPLEGARAAVVEAHIENRLVWVHPTNMRSRVTQALTFLHTRPLHPERGALNWFEASFSTKWL